MELMGVNIMHRHKDAVWGGGGVRGTAAPGGRVQRAGKWAETEYLIWK